MQFVRKKRGDMRNAWHVAQHGTINVRRKESRKKKRMVVLGFHVWSGWEGFFQTNGECEFGGSLVWRVSWKVLNWRYQEFWKKEKNNREQAQRPVDHSVDNCLFVFEGFSFPLPDKERDSSSLINALHNLHQWCLAEDGKHPILSPNYNQHCFIPCFIAVESDIVAQMKTSTTRTTIHTWNRHRNNEYNSYSWFWRGGDATRWGDDKKLPRFFQTPPKNTPWKRKGKKSEKSEPWKRTE